MNLPAFHIRPIPTNFNYSPLVSYRLSDEDLLDGRPVDGGLGFFS